MVEYTRYLEQKEKQMITTDTLDLKKSVDATLTKAKGWLSASYPSSQKPKSQIKIAIDYPENNLRRTPECVIISRGQNYIKLEKRTFGAEDFSYNFHIQSPSAIFHMSYSSRWGGVNTGNPLLLKALQMDPELSQYISLVERGSKRIKPGQKKLWDLNKIMQNSRV